MLVVSDSIKNAYNQYTTQRKSYIKVGNNSFFVQNLDVYAECYNEGNVIGNAIAKIAKFDIETVNISSIDTFELFDGIWTGNQYEYVSLGTFKLFNEKGTDDFFSSITAYDQLLYFNKEYDPSQTSYPTTIYGLLQSICSQAGVELENVSIANGEQILESNLFVENETLKTILNAICQISGNFGIISKNKLKLLLKGTETIQLSKYQLSNPEYKRNTWAINQVILGMEAVDGEYVKYPDDTKIQGSIHKLVINDNPFVYTQDLRERYIQNLYNQVNGFGYVAFDTQWEGLSYVELGDLVNLDGRESIVLRYNLKSPQGLKSTLSAPSIIDSVVQYADNSNSIANKQKRTEIIVDKQNQQINIIAGEQDSQGKKLAKLEIDVDSAKLSVSETSTALGELQKATEENLEKLQKSLDSEVLNLQNQIDGSIQFWNGADVPTLNNAPANQWETEEQRNNHRADIYTVIINDEQGKSYRFDKVNNNWVWVEITDNELSAVKALVDEAQATADSKMTVYSQTPTVPYQVGDLWWKNGELYKCIVAKSKDETFDESDWQNSAYINQEELDELNPVDESNGTELTLKNSAGLNTVDFRIDGNSYQKTRSGKNLINVDEEYTFTRYVSIPVNLPAGTYKVLCNSVFVNDEECYDKAYIRFLNNSGSYITKNKTFTLTNDATEIRLYANGYSYDESAGYTVVIDQLMIINDSVTDLTYEPYGISPSPDYPSEVEVIEGYNLFNGWEIGKKINASTGEIFEAENGATTKDYIKVDFDKYPNYYLSGLSKNLFSFVSAYDENYNFLGRTSANGRNDISLSADSFTSSSTDGVIAYLQVTQYENPTVSGTIDLINDLYTILNVGTTPKPYLPYQNIGIKNVGKNLNAGLRSGYYVVDTGAYATNSNYSCSIYPVYVQKGSTYIFSINGVGVEGWVYAYDKEGNYLGRTTISTSKDYKYQPSEDVYYFHYCFGNANLGATPLESKVQIEDNDTITSYEPYKEQITYLDLKGEFISKLPNSVQDYLTIDNQGNYGIQKNVGKHTWQEVSSLTLYSNGLYYGTNRLANKGLNTTNILSDKVKGGYYKENYGYIIASGSTPVIFGSSSETIESFNKKFVGTEIYYELAEPYYVELGKSPIKTLEGDSTMYLLSALDTNMYCKYIRNIKSIGVFQPIGDMANYYNKYEVDSAITTEKNNILLEVNSVKATVDTDGKTLASLQKTVNLKIDDDKAQFSAINGKLENGVEKVKNTLVTIDIEGLKVATNTSKISTIMTNNKFAIQNNTGTYLAYFGYDEEKKVSKAEMDNLTVNKYFKAGCHRRETFSPDGTEQRTGEFYDGGVD